MPVYSNQLHQDAVFDLSRVNDDIIEAQKWEHESAGNFIYITIWDTQYPNEVHQEEPLMMWLLHEDYDITPEATKLIELTIPFHLICDMFDNNTFITSV